MLAYRITYVKRRTVKIFAFKEEIALAQAQALADGFEIEKCEAIGPYPEIWKVGMRVMYKRSLEFGPSKGTKGTIIEQDEDSVGRPAREYQVFWVTPDGNPGTRFWTTPADVVLAQV